MLNQLFLESIPVLSSEPPWEYKTHNSLSMLSLLYMTVFYIIGTQYLHKSNYAILEKYV